MERIVRTTVFALIWIYLAVAIFGSLLVWFIFLAITHGNPVPVWILMSVTTALLTVGSWQRKANYDGRIPGKKKTVTLAILSGLLILAYHKVALVAPVGPSPSILIFLVFAPWTIFTFSLLRSVNGSAVSNRLAWFGRNFGMWTKPLWSQLFTAESVSAWENKAQHDGGNSTRTAPSWWRG